MLRDYAAAKDFWQRVNIDICNDNFFNVDMCSWLKNNLENCSSMMRNQLPWRDLVTTFPELRIKQWFLEANHCVDRLAKAGARLQQDFVVFENPLSEVVLPLLYDSAGVFFERLRPNSDVCS
ncbi:hypothetical protein SO802_008982 [Lithocarpus litseifolius]|uniref:RNase H type-1 domain-containing protein n=1 Tax=Lithocarpus litseifolius TaxID=425828 RepID=A0AAW2DE63_9ROSI